MTIIAKTIDGTMHMHFQYMDKLSSLAFVVNKPWRCEDPFPLPSFHRDSLPVFSTGRFGKITAILLEGVSIHYFTISTLTPNVAVLSY